VGAISGGTALTRDLTLAVRKPLCVIDLDTPPSSSEICSWIRDNDIRTLNVAGPRESQRPGIADRAVEYLSTLFLALNAADKNSSLSAKGDSKQVSEHD
jgi:hypothetical protein